MQVKDGSSLPGDMPLLGLYDCMVDPAKVTTLLDAVGTWLMEQPTRDDLLVFETHSQKLWDLLNQNVSHEIIQHPQSKEPSQSGIFVHRDLRQAGEKDPDYALHALDLMVEDQSRLKDWMNGDKESPIALRLAEAQTGPQLVWLECPDPQTSPSDAAGQLTLLHGGLREVVESIFADSFGLSEGELRVLNLLTLGQNLKEISDALQVSHETVRTHIKRTTAKLGVASQSQILTMVSMIDRQAGPDKTGAGLRTTREPVEDVLLFGGSERVGYKTFGPKTGMPVLYIHGLMAGRHLPETVIPLLADANVRLIVPSRPGVGDTTHTSVCPQATLTQTVDQLALVANSFGAVPAPVKSDGTGLIFALEYARAYPGRCTKILALNPLPSLLEEADLDRFCGRFQMAMAATFSSDTAVQSLLQLAYLDAGKVENEADLADWHYFREPAPGAPAEDPAYLSARYKNFCENYKPNFAHLGVDTALLKTDFTHFGEGSNLRPPVHIFQTEENAFVTREGLLALSNQLDAEVDFVGEPQAYVTGQLPAILKKLS